MNTPKNAPQGINILDLLNATPAPDTGSTEPANAVDIARRVIDRKTMTTFQQIAGEPGKTPIMYKECSKSRQLSRSPRKPDGRVILDMFTDRMIVSSFENLPPEKQERFLTIPIHRLFA